MDYDCKSTHLEDVTVGGRYGVWECHAPKFLEIAFEYHTRNRFSYLFAFLVKLTLLFLLESAKQFFGISVIRS